MTTSTNESESLTDRETGGAPPGARLRVLHVVESFASGVAQAVADYVRSTPELSHSLLVGDRGYSGAYDIFGNQNVDFVQLPKGRVAQLRATRNAIRQLQPDVIHAHSSLGGAYARLVSRARSKRRIVYTPHCYSFEREDLHWLAKKLAVVAEWVLARNTTVVAACSEREVGLANRLNAARPALYVPNTLPPATAERNGGHTPEINTGLVVSGMGRISPQKGFEFFCSVARICQRRSIDATFQWIGGELDSRTCDIAASSAVEVTGWMPNSRAVVALKKSTVYLHTAGWEGFPIAILEANANGVPVVARQIPALEGMPESYQRRTEVEIAELVIATSKSYESRRRNIQTWSDHLSENNPAIQRRRLLQAYGETPMNDN
ncbi:glycosyltransferase [Demequina soli]|uniref:glycosyltransferase n=1 Tax=Demequina soli TaxID=1638987 RepID=UPI000A5BF9B8|nr:glycosyltransferase [Demequina soli]